MATMNDNFKRAVDLIIESEGGYNHDPDDLGGKTKYGISQRSYPSLDIKSLTKEQAIEIYHRDYWTPIFCDVMPWPICFIIFDGAVNQGLNATIKILQAALGVKIDGIIGSETISALNKADKKELAISLLAARALRYADTGNFNLYGRGWMKRLFRVALNSK